MQYVARCYQNLNIIEYAIAANSEKVETNQAHFSNVLPTLRQCLLNIAAIAINHAFLDSLSGKYRGPISSAYRLFMLSQANSVNIVAFVKKQT